MNFGLAELLRNVGTLGRQLGVDFIGCCDERLEVVLSTISINDGGDGKEYIP